MSNLKAKFPLHLRLTRIIKYFYYTEILRVSKIDFNLIWTFISSFTGIAIISYLNYKFFELNDYLFLIGSFGASAVIIFGSPSSPFARPRNIFGGHIISALIGVTLFKICPEQIWFASALSVSSSIVIMKLTDTVHPPGGASALIAIIGSEKIKALGYFYILTPVTTGVLLLYLTYLLSNSAKRSVLKSRILKKRRRKHSNKTT